MLFIQMFCMTLSLEHVLYDVGLETMHLTATLHKEGIVRISAL